MSDNIFIIDVSEERSSLIRKIEYDEDEKLLTIHFRKYYADSLTYEGVFPNHFDEFRKQKSIGKYYLHYIKPNFSLSKKRFMSETKRPKTKNQASDQKRFIKISINVREIVKKWIHSGEKGDYLNMTLMMLPDGEIDKYGNLGMVVQDVPKSIYDQDKTIKGPILGNAAELDWSTSNEGIPGQETGAFITDEAVDGLPF